MFLMLYERKKFTQKLYSIASVVIINTGITVIIKEFSTVTQYAQFNFRLTNKIHIINILLF